MTPTELRTALDACCWSQKQLGRILGIQERTARYWAAGREPIPPIVANWLLKRAVHALRTPPPDLRGEG